MKNWFRPRVVVVSAPLLEEKELAGAFAIAEDDIRIRALLQVIDELEQQANAAAQESVASPGISASCNGGAEFLGLLRDRILDLQQAGFGSLDKN